MKSEGSCAFGFAGLSGTKKISWSIRLETYTDDFCLGDRQLSTLFCGSGQ